MQSLVSYNYSEMICNHIKYGEFGLLSIKYIWGTNTGVRNKIIEYIKSKQLEGVELYKIFDERKKQQGNETKLWWDVCKLELQEFTFYITLHFTWNLFHIIYRCDFFIHKLTFKNQTNVIWDMYLKNCCTLCDTYFITRKQNARTSPFPGIKFFGGARR